MAKRLLIAVPICILILGIIFLYPASYPPAHIYEPYNYDFSDPIFLGSTIQNPVKVKKVEIFESRHRELSWPRPDELREEAKRMEIESEKGIDQVLNAMSEDKTEIDWGERLFRYFILLFTFEDGSKAMYPFEINENVAVVYQVEKNSDITPGHVSPTLFTMLVERGAIRDEDLQKYSIPSWLVWIKNTFGID